jgi:hypothetical protein
VGLYRFAAVLSFAALAAGSLIASEPDPTPPPKYQFCSGTVIEVSTDRVTVRRGLTGRVTEDRRFTLTAETKVEGELKKDARVTVGFVQTGDSEVARRILVRRSPSR